jgi:preprotein translocase subunit SecA
MAGRGTDIKLGEGVKELGGLAVLGSERNESRRVDNQLRGRSGRQGDPGYSRFYVSLEDDLMKRFGNLKDSRVFAALGDDAINSGIVTKLISSAQVRVEGAAFDSRKYVLKYDEVLRQQREIMYKQRDDILSTDDAGGIIENLYKKAAGFLIENSIYYVDGDPVIEYEKLNELIKQFLKINLIVDQTEYEQKTIEDNKESLVNIFKAICDGKFKDIPSNHINDIKRRLTISIVDRHWTQHIDNMSKLREGVNYISYAQKDPLNTYINEGYKMFENMANNIALEVTMCTLNMSIVKANTEESKV